MKIELRKAKNYKYFTVGLTFTQKLFSIRKALINVQKSLPKKKFLSNNLKLLKATDVKNFINIFIKHTSLA